MLSSCRCCLDHHGKTEILLIFLSFFPNIDRLNSMSLVIPNLSSSYFFTTFLYDEQHTYVQYVSLYWFMLLALVSVLPVLLCCDNNFWGITLISLTWYSWFPMTSWHHWMQWSSLVVGWFVTYDKFLYDDALKSTGSVSAKDADKV
jgi:hypothetical protein